MIGGTEQLKIILVFLCFTENYVLMLKLINIIEF